MQIIAHRGASLEYPENTMEAFTRACEIGVDALEADLVRTKDHHIVVRHDVLIEVSGTKRSIEELSWSDVQGLEVGQGATMLTLETFLESFYGRCPLVLDLKSRGMGPQLSKHIARHRGASTTHVTSFLHDEMLAMADAIPEVARSIVLVAVPPNPVAAARQAKVKQVSVARQHLTESVVQELHQAGIRVWVYTVNDVQEADTFARWKVDGLFTDDPAAMQSFRTTT